MGSRQVRKCEDIGARKSVGPCYVRACDIWAPFADIPIPQAPPRKWPFCPVCRRKWSSGGVHVECLDVLAERAASGLEIVAQNGVFEEVA